ncbi:RHS repeat-associated core domain-containing protein [Rahnella aceris]|uniref:RHS repeat-associated core domain-containing protein n=1 Tax=Rahnella sp. (strain Y9602) TaxID=2703885 RepID=UPI000312F04A|nr:RHS repeat-associated core domain-containing protein [Rahnella aceris]
MTIAGANRFIQYGNSCLGIAGPGGLTLNATGHSNSPLWSRNPSTGAGQLHTWSPWGSGDTADGIPGFNGERPDPVSGSYHLGNGYRAYNPVLRRFNCPDSLSPFGAGGINPYAYCAGDPVNHTDPTGHISWQGIAGIAGGVIGLGLSIFTAGAAIAAAGGIAAAMSSSSTTALIVGGLGVAADATAIASGATEDVNPQASSALGWMSMAMGLTGMVAGIGAAGLRAMENASAGARWRTPEGRIGIELSGRGAPVAARQWAGYRRAVIVQGTYGIFPTQGLDLSMPAIQTCIGVYAEDATNGLLMAAHIDSNINIEMNLRNIMSSMDSSGMKALSTRVRVFGGDSNAAYLRCGTPSKYIGEKVVSEFRLAGYDSAYTGDYSGVIPKTFNYAYKGGSSSIRPGGVSNARSAFDGVSKDAIAFFRRRILQSPHEYTNRSVIMLNLSGNY